MPSKKIETKKKEFESRFVNHKLTGNVAYHEGFMNEAIEEFTFALAIYPQDAEVISARGDAYVKVRAFEKAKKDLQGMIFSNQRRI